MSNAKVMMVRDNALHERQFDCENKGCTAVVKAWDYDALLADRDRLAAELSAARALLREARGGCVGTDSPWLGSDQQEAWCHLVDALIGAASSAEPVRPCTCHPDDNPPVPCPRKYALSECRAASTSAGGQQT